MSGYIDYVEYLLGATVLVSRKGDVFVAEGGLDRDYHRGDLCE